MFVLIDYCDECQQLRVGGECIRHALNNECTAVYGTNDDLIELDGELYDEIECVDGNGFLTFSDGTVLNISYGKVLNGKSLAAWGIEVLTKGTLYDKNLICVSDDDKVYSDVVLFKKGLTSYSFSKTV